LCSSDFFCGRTLWGKEILVEKFSWVIDCGCFQTFVERENFFGKDTGKFLAKILLGVSNVCNGYTKKMKEK
jgi:hypothetical protein